MKQFVATLVALTVVASGCGSASDGSSATDSGAPTATSAMATGGEVLTFPVVDSEDPGH